MNKNGIEGSREAKQDQVKEPWSKVTQTDLERAEGKSVQLIRLLQEMYSCTREHAEVEFKRRLSQI